MKNICSKVFALFLLSLFATGAGAQSNEEAAVIKMWNDVWQTYEKNDEARMWSFYSENACEIYPDGSSMCGLKAIKEGYEMFKGMLEGQPSWSYSTPSVRFIEPNVALLLADITSDIKLKGGQQIGGKTKFSAVIRKANGRWFIEFDTQTPVIEH